ncbi:hypothetical protein VNO77_46970 [Canavalia gladiata]|uniref:Secreted protein n=1 Tax=Canavalia gladiata TaxID=3824 RepID=A0AAN9JGN5_CANGL
MLIPLFVLLLLLGREEDKKTRSVLLVSQLVASKGCPLSAGCWSSLLRGSRIQQPNLKKGKKRPCLGWSYEAYLHIMKRPSRAYLVLVLRFELDPRSSPYQRKPWRGVKLVRVRGKGFFSWCALAHFRFPFTSRGSRGSYAAAFPGPFLLVLRPEAIASS